MTVDISVNIEAPHIQKSIEQTKVLHLFFLLFAIFTNASSCPPLADFFPPPEMVEEPGLARPVVAGIVATICFLAAAVLFSTMAACFVNKQRRRKLKRKKGERKALVIDTYCISIIIKNL